MSRLVTAILLLALAAPLGGCVVDGPGYGRGYGHGGGGCFWHPHRCR